MTPEQIRRGSNAVALGAAMRDMSGLEVKEFLAALVGVISEDCSLEQWRDYLSDALKVASQRQAAKGGAA